MTIAVVTDSTSDLPPEIAKQHGIEVIPLNVHIGDDTFLDGQTITSDQMYRILPESKEIPTTSAPPVGKFVDVFTRLSKDHDAIISIHISSKLSLTYISAVNAVSEMVDTGVDIRVVDTEQASMALGWTVVHVAEKIAAGASIDDAVEIAQKAATRASFVGMVDTLDYLVRGGRIGKARGFVGSLLRIKPILTLEEGEAHPVGRARNRKKGVAMLEQMVADASPLDKLSILYTTEPEAAQAIADEVANYAPDNKPVVAQLGPVVGNYLGPGVLGLGLLRAE
ncbi:MAG: DegV family protein [Dehalococcoidia bacterium]|jgi:DegV family protein with EDD domain